MIAMILAAGRGERLRPLTDSVPKSLVEVKGQSLLDRHLARIRAAGIRDVVINLGWLGHKIVARVGSGAQYGLSVVYSHEGDTALETGGGIRRALPMLGSEPFVVVNADIYTDMTITDFGLADDAVGHLVLVPSPDYRQGGDFALDGDRVRNHGETMLTFSGVSMYRPEFFRDCPDGRFSVVPMLLDAANKGCLQGSVYRGLWADVGTPERLRALQ